MTYINEKYENNKQYMQRCRIINITWTTEFCNYSNTNPNNNDMNHDDCVSVVHNKNTQNDIKFAEGHMPIMSFEWV